MRFFTWLFAAMVFGGVGGLLTYTYFEIKHPEIIAGHEKKEGGEEKGGKDEKDEKSKERATSTSQPAAKLAGESGEKKEEAKEPPDVRTLPNGDVAVRMDGETQQRISLATRKMKRVRRRPEITAYGVLQEDPARGFMLRAPIAGYVQ